MPHDPPSFSPSRYQQAIFDWVEYGEGSAVVLAVAGSGKTTTIVEAAKLVPISHDVIFVAFNRAIAEELGKRLPDHVRASTLNSMGFSALLKSFGHSVKVDGRKVTALTNEFLPWYAKKGYSQAVKKLVGLAKSCGLVPDGVDGAFPLVRDTKNAWQDLILTYGVEPDGNGSEETLIEYSRAVLAEDIETCERVIDFDDQIYLPVVFRSAFPQYDMIFVDEAQDVNHVQRAMLRASLKPTGRLVAVGDKGQAIYGFRGADASSIENIKHEFEAIELPLSVSYRCPKAIVAEAKKYVAQIEPSAHAAEGKVQHLPLFNESAFEQSDAIICRNTAPLIELAYKLIRRGVGCRVAGRDIGQGLIRFLGKMNASSVDELEERVEAFLDRETAKLLAKGQEDQLDRLNDKVETVQVLIQELPETERTIEKLTSMVQEMFTDNDSGKLTLSTIHKAKGLEWNRVFILDPSRMPSKWAKQAWQIQQESNLGYVAVTRAKSELYYVELTTWRVTPAAVGPEIKQEN